MLIIRNNQKWFKGVKRISFGVYNVILIANSVLYLKTAKDVYFDGVNHNSRYFSKNVSIKRFVFYYDLLIIVVYVVMILIIV